MRGPLVAFLALALLAPAIAAAQDEPPDRPPLTDDYELDNQGWNGLSTVAALARGSGLSVVARQRVDWDELDSSDIVFLLYPTARVEPAHMAAFLRGGGRVLIADDFGDSTEALARLGILHDDDAVGVGAARYHDALPFAPIATPRDPDHPLAAGVDELATNHPALLPDVNGPAVVFGFGPDEGVVAAGSLGAGRFVVLSDPSVLINRMLQFEGNLQFAVNLLRFLARPGESTRLVVLVGEVRFAGEPRALAEDGTFGGAVDQFLGDFNRWLDELNDYLLTEPSLRALGAAVALLFALLAFTAIPGRRGPRLDGRWCRAGLAPSPLASPETAAPLFDQGEGRPSFALPAAVLRDDVDRRLGELLGRPAPLASLRAADLERALGERCGRGAASALRSLHRRLVALPTRAQATSSFSAPTVSRRDFERLHEDTERLYRTLPSPDRI